MGTRSKKRKKAATLVVAIDQPKPQQKQEQKPAQRTREEIDLAILKYAKKNLLIRPGFAPAMNHSLLIELKYSRAVIDKVFESSHTPVEIIPIGKTRKGEQSHDLSTRN